MRSRLIVLNKMPLDPFNMGLDESGNPYLCSNLNLGTDDLFFFLVGLAGERDLEVSRCLTVNGRGIVVKHFQRALVPVNGVEAFLAHFNFVFGDFVGLAYLILKSSALGFGIHSLDCFDFLFVRHDV